MLDRQGKSSQGETCCCSEHTGQFCGLNGWFRGEKALLLTEVCLSLALRVLAEPREPGSLLKSVTVKKMAIFQKFIKTVKSDISVGCVTLPSG